MPSPRPEAVQEALDTMDRQWGGYITAKDEIRTYIANLEASNARMAEALAKMQPNHPYKIYPSKLDPTWPQPITDLNQQVCYLMGVITWLYTLVSDLPKLDKHRAAASEDSMIEDYGNMVKQYYEAQAARAALQQEGETC